VQIVRSPPMTPCSEEAFLEILFRRQSEAKPL
jgi:hypothetical protein